MSRPPVFVSTALGCIPAVAHGFFGRMGGISTGIYASLNAGFGTQDDRPSVVRNRILVMQSLELDIDMLRTLYQIHGTTVLDAAHISPDVPAQADAMVTDQPGLTLGILSADCAPILFCDPYAAIIGAAHAGWRGALAGVALATVNAMVAKGAETRYIIAAIGPCIGAASYQVGAEFMAQFCDTDPKYRSFFHKQHGHLHFDLPGFLRQQLTQFGIGMVDWLEHDTCQQAAQFFSYRRATHEGVADYGRQISLIALK